MEDQFKKVAEEFKARIRALVLTATTDVILITHFEDLDGNTLPPHRVSIVPSTSARGPGAASLAAAAHLDAIIGNIGSLVHQRREQNLRVVGFELEITDDTGL